MHELFATDDHLIYLIYLSYLIDYLIIWFELLEIIGWIFDDYSGSNYDDFYYLEHGEDSEQKNELEQILLFFLLLA